MKKVWRQKVDMKKGFSLVEVLFSLMILSIGILSASVLMTKNIRTSVNAKNQLIASELSQEGIELVKNLKDNNSDFMTIVSNGSYSIDYDKSYAAFRATIADSPPQRRLYLNGGFFSHTINLGSIPTKFYRRIDVSIDAVQKTATVLSAVIWSGDVFPAVCNVASSCVSTQIVMPDLN